MSEALITIAFGAFLGAILTVLATKYLNDRSLQKSQRVEFLIQAYQIIEDSTLREESEHNREFEKAMASIHLLGDADNVEQVEEILNTLQSGGSLNVKNLLISLRKSLRKELGLKPVSDELFHIRLN